MSLRYLLVFLLVVSLSSYAIEDKSVPTEILSKSLKVNYAENTATYLGDVSVTQRDLLIKCDAMKIYYHNGGGAESVLNSHSIYKIEFERNVSIAKDGRIATGNEGVFEPDKDRILLTGNASIKDKENHLKGDAVVYDTVKKIFRTTNSKNSPNKRVRVLIAEN
jgi:lipopolysaccharide transport protein LptA